MEDDYITFLLNILGQTYHTGTQFNNPCSVLYDINNEYIDDFIEESLSDGYQIKNEKLELYEDTTKIGPDDMIIFEKDFLEEKAQITIPYQTVILKYNDGYWTRGKPHKLNDPDKIFEWYGDLKSYMKIDDPYMKITISAGEKGFPINIEDILFATRGMALDETRIVVDISEGGYKILSKINGNLLVLEPNMDNMST